MARTSGLRKGAAKARSKIKRAGGKKCGKGKRGRKVCISTKPIAGMKCGKNPINKLYACVARKKG